MSGMPHEPAGRETTRRCPADDLIDGWHGKPPCTCYSVEAEGDPDMSHYRRSSGDPCEEKP